MGLADLRRNIIPRPDWISGAPNSRGILLPQDVEVSLADIVPPLANISPAVASEMARQPLIPLDVSGARQFFLSWRHGRLEARCC